MMAGDNPIYVINSDIIPISVPPHNKDSARKDYINVYPGPTRESCCSIDKKEAGFDNNFSNKPEGSSLSGTKVHFHDYINVRPESTRESLSGDERERHVQGSRRDYINVSSGESVSVDRTEKCWGFQVTAVPEASPSAEDFSTEANEVKNSQRKEYVNVFPGATRNLSCSDEKETSCGIQLASGTSGSHLPSGGLDIVETPAHSNGVSCVVRPISENGSTQTADSSRRHCYENV